MAEPAPLICLNLYHIVNPYFFSIVPDDSFVELLDKCSKLLHALKNKAPLELFWVLFAMSCRMETHTFLTNENIINILLDVCTYEIYQKSDPRPLVKVIYCCLIPKSLICNKHNL